MGWGPITVTRLERSVSQNTHNLSTGLRLVEETVEIERVWLFRLLLDGDCVMDGSGSQTVIHTHAGVEGRFMLCHGMAITGAEYARVYQREKGADWAKGWSNS